MAFGWRLGRGRRLGCRADPVGGFGFATEQLALHRAGHIELPAKRQSPPNNAITHRRVLEAPSYDTTAIEMSLDRLGPLEVRLVRRAEGEGLFAHLLNRYHYLGYSRPVGEHLKYLVLAAARPIACLAWNSGPLKLKLRDDLVGAPRQAYAHNLGSVPAIVEFYSTSR